jgi:hypothetical protein
VAGTTQCLVIDETASSFFYSIIIIRYDKVMVPNKKWANEAVPAAAPEGDGVGTISTMGAGGM